MQAQRLFEAGRRKGDRHGVDLPAVACRSDGTKIPVRVLNISYDGCQLATKAWLYVGETIRLDLARLGETAAEVRWASKRIENGSPMLNHWPWVRLGLAFCQ